MSLRVLSIQSHVVHGYVGNRSSVFPLQVQGIEVDFINSVQFSNHTGYACHKGPIIGAADLMEIYSGLKANGLNHYSHILTGYVGSAEFLEAVAEIVKDIKKQNPSVIYYCDPVLGDSGQLYVPAELIPIYREKILPLADVILPNQFEAEILTSRTISDEASALACINLLHHQYNLETVVISSTSLRPSTSQRSGDYMLGYASRRLSKSGRYLNGDSYAIQSDRNGAQTECGCVRLVIPLLKHEFRGTGDLFAALTLAHLECGKPESTSPDLITVFQKVLSTMQSILRRTLAGRKQSSVAPVSSAAPDWASLELKLVQSVDDIRNPPASSDMYVECIRSLSHHNH